MNNIAVNVVFTNLQETRAALSEAVALSAGLPAEVRLVAALVNPYPLPLGQPVVNVEYLRMRLRKLVAKLEVPVQVDVRICRDWVKAICAAIPAEGVIVLGSTSPRWFPGRARRLAWRLRRAGRRVLVVRAPSGTDIAPKPKALERTAEAEAREAQAAK